MAQGSFYEESAISEDSRREAKYYKTFLILSIVFFAIAAILIFFSLSFVPGIISSTKDNTPALIFSLVTWIGGIAILILIGVLFWFIKRRFNVSYDYTFVEDELRITKVFNGRKRRYIVTLEADRILKIGYYETQSYQDTLAGMVGRKPKYMTPNREASEEKLMIYILYSSSLEKSLYILECRKNLLEFLVRAAGINKFVRQ